MNDAPKTNYLLLITNYLLDLVLIGMIIIGVYFRFSWVNWNDDTDLHPDEYGLTGTISRLAIPDSLGDYFNTRLSTVSPYDKYDAQGAVVENGPDNRMRWGQWPIIIIRYAAELTENTQYGDLRLMGRQMSALFDTLAVVVAFFIGWRLYSRRVGLLAAALSALAVMQIQQSHFMTADNFATLFVMLALLAAVMVATDGRSRQKAVGSRQKEDDPHSGALPHQADGLLGTGRGAGGRTPNDEGQKLDDGLSGQASEPILVAGVEQPVTTEAAPELAPQLPDTDNQLPNVHTSTRPHVHTWLWYALFGVFFGMALASRINLAPLAAEIIVAAVIFYAPLWRARTDLYRLVVDAGLRLALAGVMSFITFRVTQPMTFRAETGDTNLLTLHLNPDWTASMEVASAESSGRAISPPGEQWTDRMALVFPWVNMVLWGMGLPLGLMAWGGFLWAAWRSLKDEEQDAWRQHALPLTWAGGYFLFMGTRWVKSVRYFLPIYPIMALFAAWALVELWRYGQRRAEAAASQGNKGNRGTEGNTFPRQRSSLTSPISFISLALGAVVLLGTLAWAYGFTNIYRAGNTRLQASQWIFQNIPGPFNLHLFTGTEDYTEPLPAPQGLSIGATPYVIPFTARETGTVTGFSLGHAASAFDPQGPSLLHVVLAEDPEGARGLAQANVEINASQDARGDSYQVDLGPAALVEGQNYYLLVSTLDSSQVVISGSTVAGENWDEYLPVRYQGRDPFGGLYHGLTMENHWVDNEDKRQMYLNNLAQVEYIIVPSQRRLWASTRLPNTYPMLMEYYRALFDGRLGFELVAQFHNPIVIGPLQVSDLTGTAAWGRPPDVPARGADWPFNYSLLAAEEAFSVYDHAPVWVFKKRADFDMNQAAAILNAVDLSQVVVQGPLDATNVKTLFRLPADRLAEQRAGGTWSEMFDFDGLLNRHQWLGVLVWYLALIVMGWLALPVTMAALGGLPDRGYPLAKSVALLVATWIVWMLASFEVLPFTRGTILVGLAILAALSGILYWRRRAEMNAWLRANRRYVLAAEGVTLALFAFDLLIRLGNPDLWHPHFGGEKPMVFSFFNAVLKSTSFPPYNPWLSGYYLNYYYYGFVIAALPTKLLGIVPALAYNLLLPTFFALVGVNAFSVAYNLVEASRKKADDRRQTTDDSPLTLADVSHAEAIIETNNGALSEGNGAIGPEAAVGGGAEEAEQAGPVEIPAPGNGAPEDDFAREPDVIYVNEHTLTYERPADRQVEVEAPPPPPPTHPLTLTPTHSYLAGLAAALMIVVLGNLGQVYTFMKGFQNAADRGAMAATFLGDNDFSATLNGFWRVATGQATLPVGTGQWYWNATRMVADMTQGTADRPDGSEITEFPFFTFLYADLHAHMLDMPFTVLSLAWGVSYVLGAANGARRRRLDWLAAALVGALVLGVPRAANTWDFPLFLVLGVLALAAGEWLQASGTDQPLAFTRAGLLNLGFRAALVVGLAFAFYQPFETWFEAAYGEVTRWRGTTTPVWIYFYIHGLFLFIALSYLLWETRRWLAETPARVLSYAGEWLPLAAVALLGTVGGTYALVRLNVPAGLLALPLMVWAGLLLLRPQAHLGLAQRVVLFLLGTALAVTLFVELFALEGDRMNTIFKFYIQVWVIFSVACGAAVAWVWASLPQWQPRWRTVWTSLLAVLVGAAALYTVTAAAAKVRDRFPVNTVGGGCQPIAGMTLPYDRGLPPAEQPHSLYGLDYMTWSAYCDSDAFLPLAYDHEAIRWLQDNVQGSPVIAEAQSRDIYRMTSRYAWNTGLPNVVGWDFHTRQHNGAIPTEFVAERVQDVQNFYRATDPDAALVFIRRYDIGYVIVGPLERAFFGASGGLDKFEAMVSRGDLTVVHTNPGVVIYQVNAAIVASQ